MIQIKNISDVIIPDDITNFDDITANANVNPLDPAIASFSWYL